MEYQNINQLNTYQDINQLSFVRNKGREVSMLCNDVYEEYNRTEYLTQINCQNCDKIVHREDGKHFGKCRGCGGINFGFYRLTPTQQAIVLDTHDIVLSYGAMNNGKTDAFAYKVILTHLLKYANAAVLVVCHSLESIQNTVMHTIRQFIPEELIKRKNGKMMWSNKQITLISGAVMSFFPADQEGKIRSYNASQAWGPEATEMPERVGKQIAGRLRKNVILKKATINAFGIVSASDKSQTKNLGQVLLDGNPKMDSWINRKYLPYVSKIFITRDSDINDYLSLLSAPEEMKEGISLHNYPSISNPYVKKDKSKYIRLQQTTYTNKNSVEYQQNVLGKIISSAGLVYPNYRAAFITPIALPLNKMRFYLGSDLGFSNACSTVLIAEHQTTGMLYAFRGYKKRELDIRQNADEIKKLLEGIPPHNIVVKVCDSQGRARTHGTETNSSFVSYDAHGINFIAASKSRNSTIAHLNTLINEGRLKIFDNLDFLRREFPQFVYKPDAKSGEQNIIRKDCDGLDALRYASELINPRNTIKEKIQEIERQQISQMSPFANTGALKKEKRHFICENN